MTRQQSYELIKTTFTQSFDKDRFAFFINELLNGYDQSKATSYTGQMVKHAFKEHVNHCHRLGTYTTPQKETIDILTVHLTKDSKLEKARTAIRNYVAYHLDQHGKDAALVAFVSPSEKTWRFSYVKLEYKTVTKDSGKIATDTSLTPARRFSYIVGEGESCHTAQTRFVALLENTLQKPSMEDIQESFSVETVTKEFFEQYVVLFKVFCSALEIAVKSDSNLHDEFARKNINQIEYVKKLMGQIVFLYFLQRKGWLGVPKGSNWGDGPKDFLRKLANKEYVDYVNFHNDVLQPLFYDTLATDRGHEAWSKILNCRIPFLNGGLFEPMGDFDWENNTISLPNNLFSNKSYVEEHVYGTGILDVFDRYNFTVSEAEPLEKDVAIDPEMLGKIFENLIEENRRKGLGAFYTPREIVHYMCQVSLSNYLFSKVKKNDMNITSEEIDHFVHFGDQASYYEKARISGLSKYKQELPSSIIDNARIIDDTLSSVKVCDPAVGSGAYAVGMMSEIVRCRSALTPFFNDVNDRTAYLFKRQVIQNSIYGVDIDAGAVEIAKLRLWLSLVVDEEDVQQVKPLPNLDYKIVCGDSLLGILHENTDIFVDSSIERLIQLQGSIIDEPREEMKKKIRAEIAAIFLKMFHEQYRFNFQYCFPIVFKEKEGFDIVIGNPPYLFLSGKGSLVAKLKAIGEFEKARELELLLTSYTKLYPKSSKGCRDYYKWFIDLSFNILNKDGTVSLITPNTYITQIKYTDIVSLLSGDNNLVKIDDLGFSIFEVPIVPCAILMASKETNRANTFLYCDLKNIERSDILKTPLHALVSSFQESKPVSNGRIQIYKHPVAAGVYSMTTRYLKERLSISEGEHKITINDNCIEYSPRPSYTAAIYDKIMTRYTPVKIIWVPQSDYQGNNVSLHSGRRLFIRKTGDKIIASVPERFDKAIAHQNVYVVHVKSDDLDLFYYYLGLLNSLALNFLYQGGPSGQKGRILAQFRIHALERLPIPEEKKSIVKNASTLVQEILALSDKCQFTEKACKIRVLDSLYLDLYGISFEDVSSFCS